MPRVPRYTIDALRELDRQLRFAPAATRQRHMEATERLIVDLDPERNYPEDFIIYRITGYRSDRPEAATFVGRALIRDLSSLVASLSDGLDLKLDAGRPALTLNEAASRLGVSTRTLNRFRRDGLICHYLLNNDGTKQLCCFVDQLDTFARRHRDRTSQARAFTRMDNETVRRIILEARQLRAEQGVTLNEAARRLAWRFGRSHEAIRLLLRRHDQASDTPIFTQAGPLTARQIELIGRAWSWDVPSSRLAMRFGKSRPTIHRAINRWRAHRLQAVELQWVDLPTFELADAEHVILTSPAVTSCLDAAPASSHAIPLINWARTEAHFSDDVLDTRIAAFNALKRRASRELAKMADHARAEALDRIETDLRWAALLKRALVYAGLPAAVLACERAVGRGLHELPVDELIQLLALAFDASGRAVDQVDPSREQRIERLSAFLTDRSMALRAEPDQRLRAGARHDAGTIALPDLAAASVPWRPIVELPASWFPHIDRLTECDQEALTARYGLRGLRPLTIEELSVKLQCGRQSAMARVSRARRDLRRLAGQLS